MDPAFWPVNTSLALVLRLALPFSSVDTEPCEQLTDSAQETYDAARKAYRTDDLDEALVYIRRAISAALVAQSAAADCNCSDGESYAGDAYIYARKAYRSESLEDVQRYAKKAMWAAQDAVNSASDCEDD